MRKILLSLLVLAGFASQAAAQNYNATAGSGLTFGANLVGGVLFPQQNMCDPTTPARCVVVDASGRITLAPNQSVNTAQINGVTVLMGNGATGTGSQRVTLANDNTIPTGWPTAANQTSASAARGQGATGAAVPSGAQYVGINSGGNLTGWTGAVTGTGASGAALSGNPFRVALSDGTNSQNWLAAIALGDGVNGNNTGAVASWLWNGTTWDRARGDATNGAWVNVKNTLTAVTPGDGITTTIYGTAAASPVIGSPLLFNGATYDRARSGGVTGMQGVSIQASPTGGCTPNGVITAGASTNATNVKASAGTLCDFSAANTTTTLYWVHFYNNAGTPTCNTGIIESYPVSAAPAVGQVGGWSRPFPQGHAYGTGIGICITANADGTGNAAAGVTLNIGYK